MKLFYDVEALVAENETSSAIELLLQANKDQQLSAETAQEVVALSARLRDLERKYRNRLVSEDDYVLERSKINWGLLELVKSHRASWSATEATAVAQKNNHWIFIGIALLLLAIAGAGYYFSGKHTPDNHAAGSTPPTHEPVRELEKEKVQTPNRPPEKQEKTAGGLFDHSQKTSIGVVVLTGNEFDKEISRKVVGRLKDASFNVFLPDFFSSHVPQAILNGSLQKLKGAGGNQVMDVLLVIQLGATTTSPCKLPLSPAMKESGKKYVDASALCTVRWVKPDGSGIVKTSSPALEVSVVPENQAAIAVEKRLLEIVETQSKNFN